MLCAYRVITSPSRAAALGQCRSTAAAIEAAAFPAPIASVLPRGGGGNCGGTIRSGSAAATAARKLSTSKAPGSIISASISSNHFSGLATMAGFQKKSILELI
jgi:hypothetical protein